MLIFFSFPLHRDDDDHLWEPFNAEILEQHQYELTEDDLSELSELAVTRLWYEQRAKAGEIDPEKPMSRPDHTEDVRKFKWKRVRDPILPEPDDVTKVDYLCRESLRETFKTTGLQVIVKMATIELTPEKPEFPVGGWHVSFLVR